MATLSDTIKPNKTYLEAVLRTALLGKTEDEYVDFFLSGLRGRLLKNPRLYRSYGPYWPEIKKLLLERGYGNFGRLVDRDVRKIYRYDRPALTLIAATLYSQERFDNGQIYSAWHLLPVPEEVDDQDYEFESYDLEVEALAQAGENLKKRYYTVKHGTLRALQEFADKHNVEVRREGEVKLCACTVRTENGGRSSISKLTAFPRASATGHSKNGSKSS